MTGLGFVFFVVGFVWCLALSSQNPSGWKEMRQSDVAAIMIIAGFLMLVIAGGIALWRIAP